MYDLELAVSQDLGKITANFDEIKTALAEQLEEYKNKEFTEDKKKDQIRQRKCRRKWQTALSETVIKYRKIRED